MNKRKRTQQNNELLKICYEDRFRAIEKDSINISFFKRLGCDLFVKGLIMHVNSLGKRTPCEVVFVDEVRNKSMIDNLYNTIEHCSDIYKIINLRVARFGKNNCIKTGYLWTIGRIIKLITWHLLFYIKLPFCGVKKVSIESAECLIDFTNKYIERIAPECKKVLYAMTDHHFYSTIFCASSHFYSNVIQHGLIKDKSYYSPIIADHFLAWGEHTKNVLQSEKVKIAGTYKFEKLNIASKDNENTVLFCISNPDRELVVSKIKVLKEICETNNLDLVVLNHPGSFFDNWELEKEFPSIVILKEVAINTIDFSVSVIENSTIIIDLIILNKPYVVYDKTFDYFSCYDKIPFTNNSEELEQLLRNIDQIDYKLLNDKIIKYELNDNSCSIF